MNISGIVGKAKKHPYYSFAILAVVVGAGYYFMSNKTVATVTRYALGTAGKQTIISTVSGSGQVSTQKLVNLKFQSNGEVKKINVVQAQKIKAGTTIAVVDDTTALVAYEKAQATLVSAQANYDKIMSGATANELNDAKRDVDTAERNLATAKDNLDSTKEQQATSVATALRNYLNSGLTAVLSLWEYSSPDVTAAQAPVITGSYTGTASGTYYIVQQGSYFSASGIEDVQLQKFDTSIPMALGTKGLYIKFTSNQISASWEVELPNKSASSYISNLNSYQSALLSQKTALNSAENSVINAENALAKARETLADLQEPPENQDVASAKANLLSAKAALSQAADDYTHTKIIAPFDGQIAALKVEVGDQVTDETVVATIVTEEKMAEISLAESDAAKVKVGDPVNLTFDAIPDLELTGKVAEVDLLGTVSSGVVNYTVKISFDTQDDRIKPDMSMSATIITESKTDVLAVSSSAISSDGTNSYVQVVTSSIIGTQTGSNVTLNGEPEKRVVEIGVSDDTMTEIVSGLSEGEKVITRTIKSTTSNTTSGSSGSNSSIRIPGITTGGGGFR